MQLGAVSGGQLRECFIHEQGVPKRWEQATAYIRTRTLEEVLLMVKTRQGLGIARVNQQEDFKAGQKKRAEVTSQVGGEGRGRKAERGKRNSELTMQVGGEGEGRNAALQVYNPRFYGVFRPIHTLIHGI